MRPDAYLCWKQDGTVADVFVEYDTGTESLTQLKNKMPGYARLARESKLPSIVVVLVHSDQREDNAARALAASCTNRVGVYLSTHARLAQQGAAEPIWRLAGDPTRVSLRDLPRAYPNSTQEKGPGQ
ncbi:replication-relaxation family protein [Nocardiopsis synnemataformans]|uniref:replication-relaxation family protein n=1 Tax=Nocardiopsis synnemataformans TaxID=61305 RepID=UPI003EBFDFC9